MQAKDKMRAENAAARQSGVQTVRLAPGVQLCGCQNENGFLFAVPPLKQPRRFAGQTFLWVLGTDGQCVLVQTAHYRVKRTKKEVLLTLQTPYKKTRFSALPACDFTGNRFAFVAGGSDLTRTAAALYWKNLVPECAERTVMRNNRTWRDGYVLSTLELSFYAGTYPAVDHEFHIRARLAMGGAFEKDVVRRMIALQCKTMEKDRRTHRRIPCAVQRNGHREYRVMRKSQDGRTRAQMFALTGILELCESLYNYYCLTKDTDFLRVHIEKLEQGLTLAEEKTDENGRLWSDVYFEDQVIKDGAVAQAQAFAVSAFRRAAALEDILSRTRKAAHYRALAEKLKNNYIEPLPNGFWDAAKGRYVDWVDRNGRIHDHMHLLANALPVTQDFHDPARSETIVNLITQNDSIFQKFPSFVAADIAAYTPSEIGVGGPYDLCAAGRYWCHDAKLRRKLGDAKMLHRQLLQVARAAEEGNGFLGERYDMNYVYYNTGRDAAQNWHGAARYYEYPCVFLDVLIHDFFGILPSETHDLKISPCCTDNSQCEMQSYGLHLDFTGGVFRLKNTGKADKKLKIDLSRLFKTFSPRTVTLAPQEEFTYKEDSPCSNRL